MAPLLVTLLSLLATVTASLLLIRKAAAWHFIDLPDDRKIHVIPTPRTGGLAMVMGASFTFFLATSLGWIPWPNLPWQTWLAGFSFITMGALDDRFGFHPKQKFLIFLTLAALAAWPWVDHLRIHGISWLPDAWQHSPFTLSLVSLLITFWFMAVPNAVNIEDAINGYMGGFTLIILSSLAIRGLDTHLFLGALAGFLLFNWPRAKHFMGDAGSFGCGFILAESILRSGAVERPWLALALTAPISLDVAMGLLRRYRLGMGFFMADRSTCPHHVLAKTGGNTLIATPLLWLNSLGFVIFATNLWPLTTLTIANAGVLVWLNRKPLLQGRESLYT